MLRNSSHSVVLFILLVATMLPFVNFNLFSKSSWQHSFKAESSVWCLKTYNETLLCRFRNVCYDSHFRTFLFFLGEESVIKGLSHYNELQQIQLSSIKSHNQFYANLSVVDVNSFKIEKNLVIEAKAVLFARFKPNNIMHSIHDDLLPIFLTLKSVCLDNRTCMESYTLLVHDNHVPGPFFDLYKLFSNQFPIILSKLPSDSSQYLCFEEMITGLVQDSIFYQYGFKKAQGPLKTPQLTQNDIVKFTGFIKEKLHIHETEHKAEIVVISRQKSRKMLNVEEVIKMATSIYKKVKKKNKVNLIVLDLFSNKVINFIKALSAADVLIGMHGAEMIFSLFMKPNSIVVELFPYGIQPEVVSFVRPLAEIDGSFLHYFPWRNLYRNQSVAHPDAPPLFGGISHLDEATQTKIVNSHEVPPVECCNNPLYLYHMYQDTWVSGEFRNFFHDAMTKFVNHNANSKLKPVMRKWFYPSAVVNVSCGLHPDGDLHIVWSPPFNVRENDALRYSLYLQDQKGTFGKEFDTAALSLRAVVPEMAVKFDLWVAVHDDANGSKSPDKHFECSKARGN